MPYRVQRKKEGSVIEFIQHLRVEAMGHTESIERGLFIDITKHMLRKRGINVATKQFREFFHFVQECAPWFPEEGTLNLDTWQ